MVDNIVGNIMKKENARLLICILFILSILLTYIHLCQIKIPRERADANTFADIKTSADNNSDTAKSTNKLLLFYKLTCPESQSFLSTWTLLTTSVSADITVISYNCDMDGEQCAAFEVARYPTLIAIDGDGRKHKYEGNYKYEDIMYELRKIGMSLAVEGFESQEGDESQEVSFYKDGDNKYCIYSKNMNGCINTKKDKIDGYDAAYAIVGGYILNNSNLNRENIAQINKLGLCNAEKIEEKISYAEDIKNNKAVPRFADNTYEDNAKIGAKLKLLCNIK